MKNIILLSLLVLCFTSCDNDVYNKMKEIPDANWDMNETYKFDVDIQDTADFYDFYILLRHNTDYLYSNAYFFITTTMPGDSLSVDTVEFILATPEGQWIGNGSSFIRSHEIMISKNFMFPNAGLYTFEFKQAMRDSVLHGITDIGIRICKSKMD
ncbi:MAG: gliding motility lipoprotein GldH [Bacteroidales bacterium]|nr:gliding motility lipoprotein GldH [Bacteroidales bacterium]